MFAVIETGGKQYKVANNDIIKVERLPGKAGDAVKLEKVLMMGDDKDIKIGTPVLAGTSVEAEILEQGRADKIVVFKKKRRQHYRRKAGHKQDLTVLKITAIGGKKAPAKKAEPKKAEAKKAEPKKVAAKKEAPKNAEAQKAPAKKTPVKKTAAKKAPAKKAPAKKAAKAKEKK